MEDLVRAATLAGYLEVMAELGADPRPLLRQHGLSPDLLRRPEQLIPARAAIRLLEASAAATGCITLGLRMAEGRTLANLGAASLLIAHQPSLRGALDTLREYRARINATLLVQVEEAGDEAILHGDFALTRPEPARQSFDLALGVLARLCSAALGPGWAPRAACFTHPPPPRAELPRYVRLLRCHPQFDAPFAGIVVARADLDRPNPAADPQLARHARMLLETVLSPAPQAMAAELDQAIRLLLPAGRARIGPCAATLGLPVRTLQRRLDDEGTSFSEVLGRARRQLAVQYLANPRLSMTEIAGLLGYGTLAAFTRWHLAAFGLTPTATRRANHRGRTGAG
ncbi:MAG: AraC family transcriptional regulator [Proteobacteria bacterium]|nr:AraC family transcriptional regulator [Pseudomonadota bacterium]